MGPKSGSALSALSTQRSSFCASIFSMPVIIYGAEPVEAEKPVDPPAGCLLPVQGGLSEAEIKQIHIQKEKQNKIEEQIGLGLEQHKEWEPVGTQKKPAAQTKQQAKPTSAKKAQIPQKIVKKPATASQKERQVIKKKPSGAPKKAQQIQRKARDWQKTLKQARELHQFLTHK